MQPYVYRSAVRDSRRRNILMEMTLTPLRRAMLMRSRSRLRSSSLVTRYSAFPCIAASSISSSSGSRQIFNPPKVGTTSARAAISRTNNSTSSAVYRNRLLNRGRPRTSMISLSCDSEVTTRKSSFCQYPTTLPGGPVGLRNAETQTLLSRRATSGTAFCLDLGSGASHFRVDQFLRNRFTTRFHATKQTFQFLSPRQLCVESDQDASPFLQMKRPQGSKNAFFVNRLDFFFRGRIFFRQRHEIDYSDVAAPEQPDPIRNACWRGRIG